MIRWIFRRIRPKRVIIMLVEAIIIIVIIRVFQEIGNVRKRFSEVNDFSMREAFRCTNFISTMNCAVWYWKRSLESAHDISTSGKRK